jgi:EVE domain-containing protein/endonuclease NucS-like protein
MSYWIFTVAPHKSGSDPYTARQIYERRMQDHFWGLNEKAANRKNVRKGDQVIFYSAAVELAFVGTARLASDSWKLDSQEQQKFSQGSAFYTSEYGVQLEAIDVWEKPHRIADLASNLKFVPNPARWWDYLRGSIRQIEEGDYATIVSGIASQESPVKTPEELVAQGLFALETHLEDFIEHNWSKISWGAALELYNDGEQTGRQYPAGTWSIDFLAVDKTSNDFVVIELKRGRTSDTAVGQVLRYMYWVKKNLAGADRKVRGIIVASEVDDALRYATADLPNIAIKTYSVTFSLQAAEI